MMRLYLLLVPLVSGARIHLHSTSNASVEVSDTQQTVAEAESKWMTCPTGRVKTAFNRGCAIVLSDNGRGRCRLRFEDGRVDEMHAMHLERHASCPQTVVNRGMLGRQGHGIYNPAGMVGQQGHGVYNPNGGIYNPNGGMVGQQGHGVYNPNGGMVGQQGHGIYNPNGATYNPNGGTLGQNGHAMYNPTGARGQQGHGIYNPNAAMAGQNGYGTYNPNGGMRGQNGHGTYNPNGMVGQNGHGTYNPNGMVGQNGQGTYNPNGMVGQQGVGQNGHGTYNPNGGMRGQNGQGIYNPNIGRPGQNGGGVYNPAGMNAGMPGQHGGYSCPLQDQYLAGHAAGDSRVRSQEQAQQRCDELGVSCAGITCSSAARCTVRAGRSLMQSRSGEYSLMKGEPQRGCMAGRGSIHGDNSNQAMRQGGLWPQHLQDNTRCTRGEAVVVRSRLECQETALREHHPFYHFRDDNNKCDTSMTCDSPLTGTRRPWRVYALPMWPQHLADNTRCTRGGVVDVRNLLECQERAVSLGHPFYHFRWAGTSGRPSTRGKCGTVESCDSPLEGTRQIWRVYRNPLIMASPTSFQGSR